MLPVSSRDANKLKVLPDFVCIGGRKVGCVCVYALLPAPAKEFAGALLDYLGFRLGRREYVWEGAFTFAASTLGAAAWSV